MKKYGIAVMVVFAIAAFTFETRAQAQTKRADVRQHAQRARIADGRRDGEVTRREGVALHMEQRHVRRAERRAKADGEVTVEEKRRLERKQNRASRHIRRAKHNDIDNNSN
jgi:hypothetical protein